MSMWFHSISSGVKRPERVSEHIIWVVGGLDLAKARPVTSEASLNPFGWFMSAEELKLVVV